VADAAWQSVSRAVRLQRKVTKTPYQRVSWTAALIQFRAPHHLTSHPLTYRLAIVCHCLALVAAVCVNSNSIVTIGTSSLTLLNDNIDIPLIATASVLFCLLLWISDWNLSCVNHNCENELHCSYQMCLDILVCISLCTQRVHSLQFVNNDGNNFTAVGII